MRASFRAIVVEDDEELKLLFRRSQNKRSKKNIFKKIYIAGKFLKIFILPLYLDFYEILTIFDADNFRSSTNKSYLRIT